MTGEIGREEKDLAFFQCLSSFATAAFLFPTNAQPAHRHTGVETIQRKRSHRTSSCPTTRSSPLLCRCWSRNTSSAGQAELCEAAPGTPAGGRQPRCARRVYIYSSPNSEDGLYSRSVPLFPHTLGFLMVISLRPDLLEPLNIVTTLWWIATLHTLHRSPSPSTTCWNNPLGNLGIRHFAARKKERNEEKKKEEKKREIPASARHNLMNFTSPSIIHTLLQPKLQQQPPPFPLP